MDIELLRLQYEILNVPIADIAKRYEIPRDLIKRAVNEGGWKRLWPEDTEAVLTFEDGEDRFAIASDAYIEKARKRLIAYSLARETVLSARYLELESQIVIKSHTLLDNMPDEMLTPNALKTLGDLYRTLTKHHLSTGAANTLTLGDDIGTIPTLIVRDLSGRAKG